MDELQNSNDYGHYFNRIKENFGHCGWLLYHTRIPLNTELVNCTIIPRNRAFPYFQKHKCIADVLVHTEAMSTSVPFSRQSM